MGLFVYRYACNGFCLIALVVSMQIMLKNRVHNKEIILFIIAFST